MNNPLYCWKLKADSFPHIAKVAKRVLCVQASSTSSERAFSASGLVASQQRAALSPENLDAIIFLQKNMEHVLQVRMLEVRVHVKSEPVEEDAKSSKAEETLPQLADLRSCWEDI